MRVLQVIDKSFAGGGQRVVQHLLEGMKPPSVVASLACRDGGPLVEAARSLGTHVYPIAFDKRFRPGPAHHLTLAVRHAGADVVHAHGLVATFYCVVARVLFRMNSPIIYHQHGFHHHNYGFWSIGVRKAIERAVCRRVEKVVAVSGADLDALEVGGYARPPKAELIHYGIPEPLVTPAQLQSARRSAGLNGERTVVGMVARLHPQKGVDTFLKAAALVHERLPEAVFVIGGSGEHEQDLRMLANTLGLHKERTVRWLGTCSGTQVMQLFDIAVVSSRWEGLPIVLLEYMASGLPIVTTALAGCLEAVTSREALLVPPDSPGPLAEAIISTILDPEAARIRGRAGRERYESTFALSRMISRFQELYDEVSG